MKGLRGWIEIFRGGEQTDSTGREREFTDEDLDAIVESFDPEYRKVPVVVGHPEHDAPAYGWVDRLRRVGDVLQAKFKQVMPEFEEMVEQGRFTERSVSLTPDLKLRHVGFLGAAAPAVKGLASIKFNDDEGMSFEFSEFSEEEKISRIAEVLWELREWFIDKFGLEDTNKAINKWSVDWLRKDEEKFSEKIGGTDMDLQKQNDELRAENEKLKKANAELSETVAKTQSELDALKKERETERREARRREAEEFAEGLVKAGRIPPKKKREFVEFAVSLDPADSAPQQYAAPDEHGGNPDRMKRLLEFMGAGESDEANADGDGKYVESRAAESKDPMKYAENVDEERAEIHEKVMKYRDAHPDVSYEEALDKVL